MNARSKIEYAVVLLGLRTIFDGSTYLGVFLANGKHYYHPLLPRPSAPHPFSGLSISFSTALISCTSSGPVPRVTHTHTSSLTLVQSNVSSGTFFFSLFYFYPAFWARAFSLGMTRGGFDFLVCISASTTLALTCSRLGFSPEVISFGSWLSF